MPRYDHLLFAADIRYQPMAKAAPTAMPCPLRGTPIEKADGGSARGGHVPGVSNGNGGLTVAATDTHVMTGLNDPLAPEH